MKRKTKENPNEKSVNDNSQDVLSKESDVMKLVSSSAVFKSLQNKIKEQDKKIAQLFEANNEFKNSIFALYTELESRKPNKMEYPDLMKIFKNATDNFSRPGNSQSINNVFYVNGSNFNGMKTNPLLGGAQNRMNMDQQYFDNGSMKAIKEEIKEIPLRRRDSKGLRSPSPSYPEAWKRVHGVNSRPGTPTHGLQKEFTADNISEYSHGQPYEHTPQLEKNPQMMRADISVASGFDSIKDNLSVNSNLGISAFQNINFQNTQLDKRNIINYNTGVHQLNRFEHFSVKSKDDLSDLRSLSEFSADNSRFK
jgi:hypothetical protein